MTVFDVSTTCTYRVAHIMELFRDVGSKVQTAYVWANLSVDEFFMPMPGYVIISDTLYLVSMLS